MNTTQFGGLNLWSLRNASFWSIKLRCSCARYDCEQTMCRARLIPSCVWAFVTNLAIFQSPLVNSLVTVQWRLQDLSGHEDFLIGYCTACGLNWPGDWTSQSDLRCQVAFWLRLQESDLLRKRIRQVSIWMGNKTPPLYPIRVFAIHSQRGHESACGRGGGRKKTQECSRRQLALWPFRGNQAYPPKLLASLPHSVADKRPNLGWVSKEKEKRGGWFRIILSTVYCSIYGCIWKH